MGRAVPAARQRHRDRAGRDRLADLRSAAAEADRRAEDQAAEAATRSSAEASQEYLRGRFEWNNWTAEGFRRAVEHFERAIAHDPKYAPAYAGISDSYGAMAYYGFVPPEVGYPRAREAAEQALAIDPDIADAHASLALSYLLWQFDWAAAEREFTTALRLNPQLAVAHATYALYLMTVGRHDEAIQQARMAQQMDPLSLLINMTVCWALHFADRSEEAIRETRRTRELAPGFQEAGNLLMSLYETRGQVRGRCALDVRAADIWSPRGRQCPSRGPSVRRRGGLLEKTHRAISTRALADAPPSIHYGYAALYARPW